MFKIQLKDTVLDLSTPLVMGILNATPDSFFEGSRMQQIDAGVKKAIEMAQFGAGILDIGGQSTRPGAELVTEAMEIDRVVPMVEAIHAAIPNMKDILNQKVRYRESYRPFAPVCHESIAPQFFETTLNADYRWMSFCPTVREEYREVLASVTHADNTARLQTVNEQQNDWLFYLLLQLQQVHPVPVLINTSFNIAGKPILNTYRDAVWMLENTQLDGVILEDYYIKKS